MTLNDDLMTPGFFWLILLIAFVVLLICWPVSTRRENRKAKEARRAVAWTTADYIHPHCAVWGHKYRAHQTVWMCGVCGDRIPRNTLLLDEEDYIA